MIYLIFCVFGWFERLMRFPVQHHPFRCIRSLSLCGPPEAGVILHKWAILHYNFGSDLSSLHQIPSHVSSKVVVTFVFGKKRTNSLENVNSSVFLRRRRRKKWKSPQLDSTCGLCDAGSWLFHPPPPFLKACFHLCLIYLWDFLDWK